MVSETCGHIRIKFVDRNGPVTLFQSCASKNCEHNKIDDTYSYLHAIDLGWTWVRDNPYYEEPSAYCPGCSERKELELNQPKHQFVKPPTA